MRELVQSRWIVGLLIGFFVLAGQAAIPVPTVVLSQIGSGDVDASSCLPTVCRCTGCSPTNCCCAMTAPRDDDDDGRGLSMLGYNCQPDVEWFVAVLPPVITSGTVGLALVPDAASGSGADAPVRGGVELGVPTPPPRVAA